MRLMAVEKGSQTVKKGLAQMLKGGVIMDVVTPEQAKIAEEAGACAVMALERVPADIRAAGGVARMADPSVIQRIMDTVTIPVMAKCRIGHFAEALVWRRWAWTTSTNRRSSPPPTRPTTSISGRSRYHSSAAAATWARRCGASARARQ